jgi:hypothetical protein
MAANSLLFYKSCFGVKNCLARSITRAFPLLYLQSEHWYTYVLFMWINVFHCSIFYHTLYKNVVPLVHVTSLSNPLTSLKNTISAIWMLLQVLHLSTASIRELYFNFDSRYMFSFSLVALKLVPSEYAYNGYEDTGRPLKRRQCCSNTLRPNAWKKEQKSSHSIPSTVT